MGIGVHICESNVYIVEDGGERLVVKEAAFMSAKSNGYVFIDIYGNKYELDNVEIAHIDFINHKVVLRRKD